MEGVVRRRLGRAQAVVGLIERRVITDDLRWLQLFERGRSGLGEPSACPTRCAKLASWR